MTVSLDDALKRLETSLGILELSLARKLDNEAKRGDLETELQLMQDDRARLAVELDGTMERLNRVETAAKNVSKRLEKAIVTVHDVVTTIEDVQSLSS